MVSHTGDPHIPAVIIWSAIQMVLILLEKTVSHTGGPQFHMTPVLLKAIDAGRCLACETISSHGQLDAAFNKPSPHSPRKHSTNYGLAQFFLSSYYG